LTTFPLLATFWYLSSILTPRRNTKVKLPGRSIESYITFKNAKDKERYKGRNKIPIQILQEKYFDGDVEFNGDVLEVLEWRHDWADFRLTFGFFKYFLLSFVPELILHTRSQGQSSFAPLPLPAFPLLSLIRGPQYEL